MTGHDLHRFEVAMPFQVRTSDIDFAGHVSNIVYIRWLEDLQLLMLQTHCPLQQLLQHEKLIPVLLHTHIEYKREVTLFAKPSGRMWLREMGPVKMVLEARIEVDGRTAAIAEQSICFVSMENKRPVKVPQQFRRQYAG